jgi:hypothetical protein
MSLVGIDFLLMLGVYLPILTMKNRHGVDLEQTLLNADKDGIDLSQITLFYSDLNESEILKLERLNLIVAKNGAVTIGRFTAEGLVLFRDKVTGVYSLSV